MSTTSPTGLLLDGVFASEAIDSSGEILSIKGMDISTFEEGKGLANYEHKDSSGDSNGQEIVGKVVYVRKVFNEDDCLDDRQKLFWKRTKVPFLYGVVRLYDGAGHDGAKALAASIRDSVAHEEPIIVGFSIEGATLERDGNKLKSTIGRLVALTTKPCNKQAVSGILADPNAPEGYSTNPENARTTLKSITDPLNMRLGGSLTEYGTEMLKALTAGSYGGPPSTLTGGAALQREDKTLKAMAKAAARDWPKTGKFREFLKSYLTKAELGDVSDEFLDHYSDLVESKYYRVKKAEEVIATLKKAGKEVQWKPNVSEKTIAGLKQKHGYETPEQRKLVDGIVRKNHHSKAGAAKAKAGGTLPLLTNNGAVVKPNKNIADPTFDAGAGVLHMPQGSFKVYLPHQDTPELSKHFDDLLSSPKVEKFHGYAMQNWVKAHQLLKAGKLPPEVAMHAVLFSNLSPNCLDSQTEALTQRGWVRGFDLTIEDKLLTKNPTSGELEWEAPTDLKLFPDYKGSLVRISSRSFEVVTTPDHRWLVNSQRGHVREKTSRSLTVGDRIHRTGTFRGAQVSGLTPDEAEVLGWFVTDGYWSVSKNCNNTYDSRYEHSGRYARICQSSVGNPDKCRRIDELLTRLAPDEVSSHIGKDGKQIWTVGPKLTSMLAVRAPERVLTVSSLLDLSVKALHSLADAMFLGDGNSWTNGGWKTKRQLTTGRKEQAEAFQVLLTLLGYASSCVWRDMSSYSPQSDKMHNVPKMTGVYVVTQLNRKYVNFNPDTRVEFEGKEGVWCPMVPNTFFVARRLGQVFVTGNTPVPMQELMYGHLVDSMKDTGLNPLSPNFEDMRSDWRGRDSATKLPDHSPQHWKRLLGSLRLKHDSKKTGRVEGQLGSFVLADDKFDNMSKYVEMHQPLQELLGRYKHNARGAAEEMMNHKQEQVRWENRRRLAAADGKPDPGKYPGMSISGLAPKTTRYALGMMGGGNVVVPDTHFVRNLFGLNREQDGDTIEAIKKALWNHRSAPVLNGIDQFYANNHPAVKHMLQHPKWGKYFEKPEDAVFPAFWKHWMAIVPHERARGHTVRGYNELTDHRPFWEAVAPFTKSENTSLPEQTARQHAQWVTEYGEVPAGLLYAHHLLPRLLAAAASREAQTTIRKAQELQIELLAKRDPVSAAHSAANSAAKVLKQVGTQNAHDESTDTADYRDIPNRPIVFQGRHVKPGKAQFNDDNFHVLGTTATHLLGLPANKDPYKGWTDQDLVKLDRNDPDLNVYGYPESVNSPGVVNADIHGVMGFVDHPETRALAHGFNFDLKSDKQAAGGVTVGSGDSYWGKSPTGQHVFVKASSKTFNDSREGSWNTARKEGIYHNIAKDFFGLGAHVPNVAVVRHPRTGQEHALISHVDGHTIHMLRPYDGPNRKGYPSILGAIGTPTLQKLGIMNSVMGNIDRHDGNYMVNEKGPDGQPSIALIDHNIFGENGNVTPRYLLHAGTTKQPLHPEVVEWLKTLDMDAFKHHLIKNGVPEVSRDDGHFVPSRPILQPMLARLQYYKDHAHNDATFGYALHNAASAGQGDGVIQIPNTSSQSQSDLDY